MVSNIIGNIKVLFLGENFVWSPGFLSGAESFNLNISCKTTSWITSIYSSIWVEVDGTLSLSTNVRMDIFSEETYFENCVSISFLLWIPEFSFFGRLFYLSTSSLFNFNLSTSSLFMNFIITYQTWFPSLLRLWIFWQFPSFSKSF